MYLLGYDIGSSSIKASLIEVETGKLMSSAISPEDELEIQSPKPGWAEQDPDVWWKHIIYATRKIIYHAGVSRNHIEAIGISYQMHGLVLVDEQQELLRPSIIWCDGRAVEIGRKAFQELGKDTCLEHFLNSPGNFTASKLKWVKENEPDLYQKAYKFMLPGDYIAMKMTGRISTTVSGLSEGVLWDYPSHGLARQLLDYYGISESLIPEVLPNFSAQGTLSKSAAGKLGLPEKISVTYRAGDQPNNALSLNVLNPGEVAATAGTSGVIYGVTDKPVFDKQSRINTFVHVNYAEHNPRYGVLLCINGTGIQYSWLKNKLFRDNALTYEKMNKIAASVPAGSDGVFVFPFGNGPERIFGDLDPGARLTGVNFNRHDTAHVLRASQEGIAFALNYGLQIMKTMGIRIDTIRVARTNMFQSPVFREAFANTTGAAVELYETDGSRGAAIGAGVGAGIYKYRSEAFPGLTKPEVLKPDKKLENIYQDLYMQWKKTLEETILNSRLS